MPRYIDVDNVGLTDFEIVMCDDYKKLCKAILEKIDLAPTVDAVEVVRCGECVHGYRYFEAYGLDCLSCRKLVDKNGNGIEFPVLPDGYCSQGKCREDGDGDANN